jgi:hypothetical protein
MKLCVGVDDCSALRGVLIMAEDNSDGEQTLKRGDDTYKNCRGFIGIDGLTIFRGLRKI